MTKTNNSRPMAAGTEAPGLEFPCELPIKAMGAAGGAFADLVREIVAAHAGRIGDEQVRIRRSSGGKFQSVTVTVRIDSRQQLERVYRDLADAKPVLWTL